MARVGSVSASKLAGILTRGSGLPSSIGAIAAAENVVLESIGVRQVVTENVAAELIERSASVRYPMVHLYCERISNTLREKFRTFSGRAHLVMELRVSSDRVEELERKLQLYVDAATRVLDKNRGDWGDGVFYGGTYEVTFGPVRRGGKHFLQMAKVGLEVDVSL